MTTSSHRVLLDTPHRRKPTMAENTKNSQTLTVCSTTRRHENPAPGDKTERSDNVPSARGKKKRPPITVLSPVPSPIRVSAPIAAVQSSHHSSTARSCHGSVRYVRGTSNHLQGGFYNCRVFDCECTFSITSTTTTTLHPEDDIVSCPNKSFIQRKVEPIFGQKHNWGRSTSVFSTFLEFYRFPFFLTEITKYNTN